VAGCAVRLGVAGLMESHRISQEERKGDGRRGGEEGREMGES
jgi:hypothetical protein